MNHDQTPVELRGAESAVESLARAEQESAPVTLEARLFMATRGLLPSGAARPEVVVRRPLWTRFRVAASVAVLGTVVAAWLSQQGRPAVSVRDWALSESDAEFMLALRSDGVDVTSTRERLDSLFLDTNSVAESLHGSIGLPLDEGAL